MGLLNRIFMAAVGCCALATAGAQTVTVSNTVSADYTTVQNAIAFFATADPDPSMPNVITILDSSLYNEVVTVNAPVTLQGDAGQRPILAVQANAEGRAASAGLVIKLPTLTTDTVVLRNLTIIPSLAPTPLSSGINVVNNNVFLFLDNVLLTANNGSNVPTSTDGLTVVAGTQTHFGDDGLYFGDSAGTPIEGAGAEVLMRNTIITNIRGTKGSEANSCGVIVNNNTTTDTAIAHFRKLRIEDGCIISANNGRGIWQAAIADIEVDAPVKRALIIRNTAMGVLLSAGSINSRYIRGGIFAYNSQQGIYENSFISPRCSIDNSIIARNTFINLRISNTATGPMNISNSTVAYDSTGNYQSMFLDSNTDITFKNCILAGDGAYNVTYNLISNTSGSITLDHTAVVEAGPAAFRVPTFSNPALVSGIVDTTADPQFVNTTAPESPDFFDVASRSYAHSGTANNALSGGADYITQAPITEYTYTISKTAGADFNTIQGAINALPLDSLSHYTLQITDSSVYDEIIDMTVPVTLIGTGSARPVLAVRPNSAGYDMDGTGKPGTPAATDWAGDAGLLINIPSSVTTCSVALKNLIIIPSKSGTPPVAGIVSKANNFYLEMDNVLVTGNNGNDAPMSVDGLTSVSATAGQVSFLVSGAHLGSITFNRAEGAGVDVFMRNCKFTNIRATLGDTWRTGLYMYRTYYTSLYGATAPGGQLPIRQLAFRSLRVGPGCLFTFNDGDGLRAACSLTVDTPLQRAQFTGNLNNGLWCDMQQGRDVVNGAVIANNGRSGINEGVGNNGERLTLKNSIVANNGGYGTYNRLGGATQNPTLLQNVTLANNGAIRNENAIYTSANNSVFGIVLKDSILAGTGTGAIDNVTSLTSAGSFTMQNSAVVSQGPFALSTTSQTTIPGIAPRTTKTGTDGAIPTVVGTPASSADPGFRNTVNPFAADFYAVSSTAYSNLNSAGGPLSGGGLYVPPAATVLDWNVY